MVQFPTLSLGISRHNNQEFTFTKRQYDYVGIFNLHLKPLSSFYLCGKEAGAFTGVQREGGLGSIEEYCTSPPSKKNNGPRQMAVSTAV
ncbi:hypothetical protein P5673_013188 [Acropora cervicornis]|uniref:Uncharacterized protein n=1 Tax=Acropora cervicornis TaxID=6130 RepID=A0AAD9V6V6_ACRCE|nr:hypothetical protein P5673_013188 [Acropora cervicornis]